MHYSMKQYGFICTALLQAKCDQVVIVYLLKTLKNRLSKIYTCIRTHTYIHKISFSIFAAEHNSKAVFEDAGFALLGEANVTVGGGGPGLLDWCFSILKRKKWNTCFNHVSSKQSTVLRANSSRLDFYNMLFGQLPLKIVQECQLIYVCGGHNVSWRHCCEPITPSLYELHWLSVSFQAQSKYCFWPLKPWTAWVQGTWKAASCLACWPKVI